MDVTAAEVPSSYDGFRAELRAFIATSCPSLGWKPRAGVRVPEEQQDVVKLRAWAKAINDAGYVFDRFAKTPQDPYEQRVLEEELAATGIPHNPGNSLVAGALRMFGTEEQKRAHIEPMARGEQIWTQLFSEPNAGSDLASLQTRGRLDGDHYVVDGQKVWSTWAQFADYGYLLARTEPDPGPAGITALILDMTTPGVEVRPLREMTGTNDFNEVFFNEVRVPVANVIGEPGEGWRVSSASLATERGGVGEQGSFDTVLQLLDLAQTTSRSGSALSADAMVRDTLARFAVRSRIQELIARRVQSRVEHGTSTAWDAPMVKIWFSELNLEMLEYGLELLGPRSILTEGDPGSFEDGFVQDAFLYARAWTIAGGSNEIMRNLIAERGLGLPREPRGTA
jgi:alkylation response protein AidB-like acyl-CoA dehydrogenase